MKLSDNTLFDNLDIVVVEENSDEEDNHSKESDKGGNKIGYVHKSHSDNAEAEDPEEPDEPENPDMPEEPDNPDTPEEPEEPEGTVYKKEKTVYPIFDKGDEIYIWDCVEDLDFDFESDVTLESYNIYHYKDEKLVATGKWDGILGTILETGKKNTTGISEKVDDKYDKAVHILKGVNKEGKPVTIEITYILISDLSQVHISDYFPIPEGLGEPTLTSDEISALVGKKPEEIREAIKTIDDLINYCAASGFSRSNAGDYKVFDEETHIQWHTNTSGYQTIKINRGNCGACSNLAAYTLDGDYDEIGFINWQGDNGGHVINYILEDGTYYVFDMQQTIGLYEEDGRYDFQCHQLENAIEFKKLVDIYNLKEAGEHKADYLIWYASDEVNNHTPLFDTKDVPYYMGLPTETKDIINIAWVEDNHEIKYFDLPDVLANWTDREYMIDDEEYIDAIKNSSLL